MFICFRFSVFYYIIDSSKYSLFFICDWPNHIQENVAIRNFFYELPYIVEVLIKCTHHIFGSVTTELVLMNPMVQARIRE